MLLFSIMLHYSLMLNTFLKVSSDSQALLSLHVGFTMIDALSFLVWHTESQDSKWTSMVARDTGNVSEGRFIENSRSWPASQLCRHVACRTGRTVESPLIWLRCRCVCAELCCQQILLLWRCIHNWFALLCLLHCPPETLEDKAINPQLQHLTTTFLSFCCLESTSM